MTKTLLFLTPVTGQPPAAPSAVDAVGHIILGGHCPVDSPQSGVGEFLHLLHRQGHPRLVMIYVRHTPPYNIIINRVYNEVHGLNFIIVGLGSAGLLSSLFSNSPSECKIPPGFSSPSNILLLKPFVSQGPGVRAL